MRHGLVLSLAMLVLVLTRVQAQAPVPSEPALKANLLDAINGRFERFQRETHAPGLVWGIVADGRLIYVNAFGVQDIKSRRPVTAESVFRIASMSKAFTALALLKLREAGKLSLDDLLARYIPEAQNWQYQTFGTSFSAMRGTTGKDPQRNCTTCLRRVA